MLRIFSNQELRRDGVGLGVEAGIALFDTKKKKLEKKNLVRRKLPWDFKWHWPIAVFLSSIMNCLKYGAV